MGAMAGGERIGAEGWPGCAQAALSCDLTGDDPSAIVEWPMGLDPAAYSQVFALDDE